MNEPRYGLLRWQSPKTPPEPLAPGPGDPILFEGSLSELQPQVQRSSGRRAVVFVHGINSNYETFKETYAQVLVMLPASVEYLCFNFKFFKRMEDNGKEFGDALAAEFNDSDRIAIIGHSMGGLVSRFAVLSQRLEFVKALYLLGTPNSGALRLSQLTALAQLFHGAANGFRPIFARNPGVISLSQAAKLIEAQRSHFENALGINYISIPGLYYHKDRTIWELPENFEHAKFTALQLGFFLLNIGSLGRPHDGIVDEASNYLARCERDTEKLDSYRSPPGLFPKTYMHLRLAPCRNATHVEIHKDPTIISVVADLIASEFGDLSTSLEDWVAARSKGEWFQKGLDPQW